MQNIAHSSISPPSLPHSFSLFPLLASGSHLSMTQVTQVCEVIKTAQAKTPPSAVPQAPPGSCTCGTCNARRLSHQRKLMNCDEWEDVIYGDFLSEKKQIALARAKTKGGGSAKGESQQMVVLWYLHGKPLMGRGWIEDNALKAIFVSKGKEYTGRQLAGIQVLVQSSSLSVGFEYVWMNFEQWNSLGDKDITTAVQVGHVAPCIINHEGKEVLGSLEMDTEVAEGFVDGKCVKKDGAAVKNLLILCRKDIEDIVGL